MRNRYLTLLTTTALLTAAASVAQPQTVDPSTGMTSTGMTSSSSTTTTTNPDTTGTTSTSGTTNSTDTTNTTSTTGTTGTTAPEPGTLGTPAPSANAMDRAQSSTSSTDGSSRLQGEDAAFLQRAVEMGRLEVAHAQAALDNAQRTDTRTAARMLLEDHQRSNEQLQQLASRKGWSMPAASESAESDQARAVSGAGAFDDDRFMAEQIRMHRDAISLYRAQASSGADPELRQFARDQLPHLEHHLEMLQGRNTQK